MTTLNNVTPIPISDLPAATTLTGNEATAIVQNNQTVQTPINELPQGMTAGVVVFGNTGGAPFPNYRTLKGGNGVDITDGGAQGDLTVSFSGMGSGTVTSVSVVTANGFSGSVANPTTTPAITLNVSALDAAKIANGSVSNTEFQYLDGVTSSIQTQLNNKIGTTLNSANIFVGNVSNVATGMAVTGDIGIDNTGLTSISSGVIVNSDVNASAAIALSKLATTTVSRALVSDGSGFVSPATTTATEIGYVNGVTSAIQTQLNTKLATVTADAPLSGSGTSASHLVISQATTSTNGYLSSTDWNTFNNKGSGTVTSVSGTTNRITSTGGATPVIDISASYAGQSSIVTTGTLTGGATGAGFTVALGTSTITGDLPFSNIAQLAANTVAANPTNGTADISTVALAASQLLGRGSSGDISAITLASPMQMVSAALGTKNIKFSAFTRDLTAASGSVAYTGAGFTPRTALVLGCLSGSAGRFTMGGTDAVAIQFAFYDSNQTTAASWTYTNGNLIFVDAGGGNNQSATISSFDSDGMTLAWTKAGTPTGTASFIAIYFP